MSSKGKKAQKPLRKVSIEKPKAEEKPAVKPMKEAPRRPKGPAPWAVVSSRHDGGMVERQGRGFSTGELEGAGFDTLTADRWKLQMDIRRRSVLEKNVQGLRNWFVPSTEVPRPAPVKEVTAKAEKAIKERPKKRSVRKKTELPSSRPRTLRA